MQEFNTHTYAPDCGSLSIIISTKLEHGGTCVRVHVYLHGSLVLNSIEMTCVTYVRMHSYSGSSLSQLWIFPCDYIQGENSAWEIGRMSGADSYNNVYCWSQLTKIRTDWNFKSGHKSSSLSPSLVFFYFLLFFFTNGRTQSVSHSSYAKILKQSCIPTAPYCPL